MEKVVKEVKEEKEESMVANLKNQLNPNPQELASSSQLEESTGSWKAESQPETE